MSDAAVINRVRELVLPIVSDLGLELYDVERHAGTLRVVLSAPTGSDQSLTVDTIALASRLVSRELDHADPLPGRYTLEVTSPGVERSLRTPEHFRGAIGERIAVRLRDVANDERRIEGELVAVDDTSVTIQTDPGNGTQGASGVDGDASARVIRFEQIDRARTTFVWGSTPKTGSKKKKSPTRKEKRST